MLTHRGFSAWITVGDEEKLPEYLVAVDSEDHRVSCWIPGEEGKKFTVWWQDHGGGVDTCSYISLDGITVPGRFLLGTGTASRSGARADQYRERPFKFMKIPDKVEGKRDSDADVGTIVLKIKRIRRVEDTEANAVETLPNTVPGKRKAGDLCVGLGPLDETAKPQYPRTWKCLPYDITPGNSTHPATFVSFVFRYRTQEFLETQGIAEKKKSVPARAAPAATVQRHASASAILPPPTVYNPPSSIVSPSPPKRARTLDQAALGRGSAPITIEKAGSSEVRRTSSYYRPQTYEQTGTSPASMSTPTASTSAPTPAASTSTPAASTSAATTPASSLPSPLPPSDSQPQPQLATATPAAQKEGSAAQPQPQPQPPQSTDLTEEVPEAAPSASASSSTTSTTPVPPTPTTPATNGKGESLFMLPRSASQSSISSPPQKSNKPASATKPAAGIPKSYSLPAMTVPMGTTGYPVQMYPYYPYPGTLPSVPPTGAFPYYPGLNPYAWMGSNAAAVAAAMGFNPAAVARTKASGASGASKQKKPSGSSTEPPPMGSLSDTTTPSPSTASGDTGGEQGGEEKGEEEPAAKKRRTDSESVS